MHIQTIDIGYDKAFGAYRRLVEDRPTGASFLCADGLVKVTGWRKRPERAVLDLYDTPGGVRLEVQGLVEPTPNHSGDRVLVRRLAVEDHAQAYEIHPAAAQVLRSLLSTHGTIYIALKKVNVCVARDCYKSPGSAGTRCREHQNHPLPPKSPPTPESTLSMRPYREVIPEGWVLGRAEPTKVDHPVASDILMRALDGAIRAAAPPGTEYRFPGPTRIRAEYHRPSEGSPDRHGDVIVTFPDLVDLPDEFGPFRATHTIPSGWSNTPQSLKVTYQNLHYKIVRAYDTQRQLTRYKKLQKQLDAISWGEFETDVMDGNTPKCRFRPDTMSTWETYLFCKRAGATRPVDGIRVGNLPTSETATGVRYEARRRQHEGGLFGY